MTRLAGLVGAALGTVGVFALLLAMNGLDRSPPQPPPARVTELRVAPVQRPTPPSRPKPPPRQRPPARAKLAPPTLAAGLGGFDLGLLGGGIDLGDSARSLLGDSAPAVMTADSVDTLPTPTTQVAAPYPARARSRGISGEVVLLLSIDERGRLLEVEVSESQPPGVFDAAALQTVRKWRFAPATYQGRAVAVTGVPLPIRFDLER